VRQMRRPAILAAEEARGQATTMETLARLPAALTRRTASAVLAVAAFVTAVVSLPTVPVTLPMVTLNGTALGVDSQATAKAATLRCSYCVAPAAGHVHCNRYTIPIPLHVAVRTVRQQTVIAGLSSPTPQRRPST